ncbi:hypothetical protein [uncultured Nostoc sp.]|uniref:hypothetical protein n=1 Tax=uncultured Nostoc sp. TaxID=340711 RepID=UPI0035CAC60C
MTKNNRKKAVAQAISTAVALGWVIMQVESAQAATLTVNNLNDSGVGSLRDTINIATSNDVVEFLLGSHPSTINLTSGALAIAKNLTINGPGANLLTISSNNHFPVFDINAADVTLSGLAIAGDFNAYDSGNLTFINSTINGDNVKIDNPTGELTLINSTINGNNSVNINTNALSLTDSSEVSTTGELTFINSTINGNNSVDITTNAVSLTESSQGRDLSNTTNAGDLTLSTGSLTIPNSTIGNSGQISDGLGGNISLNVSDLLLLRRPIPEPSAIAGDSNNSGAGGNIIVTASDVILLARVPEPSAIAGSILAASLAWLAKRNLAAFRKAKV